MADNKNRQALSDENLEKVAGGYIVKDGNKYYIHDDKTGDILGKDKWHRKHGYTNWKKAAQDDYKYNNKYRDPNSPDYLPKLR